MVPSHQANSSETKIYIYPIQFTGFVVEKGTSKRIHIWVEFDQKFFTYEIQFMLAFLLDTFSSLKFLEINDK
jgi:hypothetical protein